jgi:tRNA (guanine37-N1)-methyltransferase
MTPQGERFSQATAERLSRLERIVMICGRYEGVDERISASLVTDEISIGDYVLTGGELPALVVLDALTRLVPGVVGDQASVETDSFSGGLLDCPHYTRPVEWRGMAVPGVLVSGHHQAIDAWRRRERVRRTFERRPDLVTAAQLSAEERRDVDRWREARAAATDPEPVSVETKESER